MGQKNPRVVKIIQNLLTCHILEAFSVSNDFLSGVNFSLQSPHLVSQTDTKIQFSL